MITPSTLRPAFSQCRAGLRVVGVQRTALGSLGMSRWSYPALTTYTDQNVPAANFRPFYRPAKSWHDQRKRIRPQITTLTSARHASVGEVPTEAPVIKSTPYSDLTVGIVRETFPNERRVAITPQNVILLLKKGFSKVLIERGDGIEAQFPDSAYEKAGATLGDSQTVWRQSDIIMKVRAPSFEGDISEVDRLKEGATLISFIYPAQNKKVVEKLASRGTTAFAMDMIPRISRAQVFDALR